MTLVLYDKYLQSEHASIYGQVEIPYTHRDVETILEHERLKRWNHHETMERIVWFTAVTLGERNGDDFKFVLDYAIKHQIQVKCTVELARLLDSSLAKYIEYFSGKHLSDATKMKCCQTVIGGMLNDSMTHGPKLARLINILLKLNLQDASSTYKVQVDAKFGKQLREVLLLGCQFSNYNDFIKLYNLQSQPHLFEPIDRHAVKFLRTSMYNRDGRVFDYFYDKYVLTNKIEIRLMAVALSSLCNPRSLLKLLKAEMKQNDSGHFYRYGLTRNIEVMQRFALLGEFKDPMFVKGFHSDDVPLAESKIEETRDLLRNIDTQSDTVIRCLKSKLPNVLVDLVLSYLV